MVQSHLSPFRNIGNFVHPTFNLPYVFRKRHYKSWRSIPSLSGVYARESKRFHTGSKCVTCSGLTNLIEKETLKTNDNNGQKVTDVI